MGETSGVGLRVGLALDDAERRWLLAIVLVGALLRLGMAFYLGNRVEPTPAAYDQIFFHDVALNLLDGQGFSFDRPPWPFIEPGAPTAYTSFVYQLFLAGIYAVFGPHPLAARIIQALLCSLMPWLVYGLVRRILGQPPAWQRRAGRVALVAAAITAGYAYFVYYSATLMTEGPYLLTVAWALVATLDVAGEPALRRWVGWALAVSLATLLRQVFIPMAGLLLLYILWRAWRRVRVRDVLVAAGLAAVLILPWTVRNYLVFDRFLLLNSQAGQVLWNANHPGLGTRFDPSAMFPVPEDLRDANEVDLSNELLRRGWQGIAADPWRFVRLSLSRAGFWVMFWPSRQSSVSSNIARTASFGVCLPFIIGGLVLSAREWRRWTLLYLFIALYTLIHLISWVQIRYRMPVDVALMPFAALAVVGVVGWVRGNPERQGCSGVRTRRDEGD